jgi:hypothetical protein
VKVDGDYTVAGLAAAMNSALGKETPPWLALLASEAAARKAKRVERAVFGMG